MGKNELSEKETKLLLTAWGICNVNDNSPKVDYNKLAELCGYGTTASATTCYHTAKKKFFILNGVTDFGGTVGRDAGTPKKNTTTTAKKTATPKSASKKRGAATMGGADNDEEETEAKPKKGGRGGKKARVDLQENGDEVKVKGEVKAEEGEEDDGLGELLAGARACAAENGEGEGDDDGLL